MNRRQILCSAIVLSALGWGTPSQAFLISSSANLPPAGVYLSTDIHVLYTGPALAFLITLPEHAPIVAQVNRYPGGSIPGTGIGSPADEIEEFGSTLDAHLTATVVGNGAVLYDGPVHASGGPGTVQTIVYGKTGNVTGTFNTEMLQMNLQGVVPSLAPFMIRESPTKQSLGQVSIANAPGGQFKIDSFFDVFTELSIDGGATWMPGLGGNGPGGSGHVELQGIPEPASIALVAFGLIGIAGLARRRR